MRQKKSWEITDSFWEVAQPLIPHKERDSNKEYNPPIEARSRGIA